jgi:hypothetical protein
VKNMDYLDYSDLSVRNCIMTNLESKKNIEMMCLDDPNEINFFTKNVVYNVLILWSNCNLNMNVLFITWNTSRDDPWWWISHNGKLGRRLCAAFGAKLLYVSRCP